MPFKAIRLRLINAPAVTALTPAASIMDRSARPERFPCIIIGEGQTVLEGADYSRLRVRTYADLHIWTQEEGLASLKRIAGAVVDALEDEPFWSVDGHFCADLLLRSVRYMRDPAGQHGHAIVTVEALLVETI